VPRRSLVPWHGAMALESVPCKPCQVGKGFRSVYLAGLVQPDCNFHVCMSFFGLQCNLDIYDTVSLGGLYYILQFLGGNIISLPNSLHVMSSVEISARGALIERCIGLRGRHERVEVGVHDQRETHPKGSAA